MRQRDRDTSVVVSVDPGVTCQSKPEKVENCRYRTDVCVTIVVVDIDRGNNVVTTGTDWEIVERGTAGFAESADSHNELIDYWTR